MRSRYSAFCVGNAAYLCGTHHPSQHDGDISSLQSSINDTKWLGLIVVGAESKADTGTVEFSAFYEDGKNHFSQLHEKSNFVREDNHWYYLDGELLPPLKLGRNDLCFCGSGKKVKRCHS